MCAIVRALLVLPILTVATENTCDHPKMTITTSKPLKIINKQSHFYEIHYGIDVNLHCSSKTIQNLTIANYGTQLDTETFNDTTIVFNATPNTGLHKYTCTDNTTGCVYKIILKVSPVSFATSPSIRETVDASHKRPLYFVPIGEVYEVACVADDATSLQIYYIEGYKIRRLLLNAFNGTTAHSKITAEYPTEIFYYCSNKFSGTEPIAVVTDYDPKAEEIQCILYQSKKIECTWKSLSKKINTFKLFYKKSENIMLTCVDNYKTSDRGCTGNMPGKLHKTSVNDTEFLILQTCNEIFCGNQTIIYNEDTILKLDPASDLRLLNTSGRSATVSWRRSNVMDAACDFKVEYRLLSTLWLQVNTSAVECDPKRGTCEFKVPLPCSDSHYELQVSMKLRTAVEERYWSDPSSIFFFTGPNSGKQDAMCTSESKELEPLPDVETMLFKVRELIRFKRKDGTALKKMIRALKKKVARIKELVRLIELEDKKE